MVNFVSLPPPDLGGYYSQSLFSQIQGYIQNGSIITPAGPGAQFSISLLDPVYGPYTTSLINNTPSLTAQQNTINQLTSQRQGFYAQYPNGLPDNPSAIHYIQAVETNLNDLQAGLQAIATQIGLTPSQLATATGQSTTPVVMTTPVVQMPQAVQTTMMPAGMTMMNSDDNTVGMIVTAPAGMSPMSTNTTDFLIGLFCAIGAGILLTHR